MREPKLCITSIRSELPTAACRTTRININRMNINPNDYYNPVIDYYNPLLGFEPCLNQLGLIFIRLILILTLDPVIDYYNP